MSNEELIQIAEKVKINAINTITGYKVGAAVLAESGRVYTGVNVEEKNIPNLSICGERNAIQNAYTNGEKKFLKIAVVGGMKNKIDSTLTPCGICLQYMLDLCPNIKIVAYINGEIVERSVRDFLLVPFILDEKK